MPTSSVTSYPQLLKTLATEKKIVYLCGAGESMSLAEHHLYSSHVTMGLDNFRNRQCGYP